MMQILLQTYDLTSIGMGPAILFVGVLALLFAAAVIFRNPAAVIAWCFVILLFVFSGLFNLGFELVWIGILVVIILVVVGVVARWAQ